MYGSRKIIPALTLCRVHKLIKCLVFRVCFSKMSSQLSTGPKLKQKLNSLFLELGYAPSCHNSLCPPSSWNCAMKSKRPVWQEGERVCCDTLWGELHWNLSYNMYKHPASWILSETQNKRSLPRVSLWQSLQRPMLGVVQQEKPRNSSWDFFAPSFWIQTVSQIQPKTLTSKPNPEPISTSSL